VEVESIPPPSPSFDSLPREKISGSPLLEKFQESNETRANLLK